jgi:hypothetical protein
LLPLVIGLALCGLGVWSGLVYQHNQGAFRAQAVKATAVIDKLYTSAPSEGVYPPTFDEYALVHFDMGAESAHARVLLASNCSGTCVPQYRVGQVLIVDYSPSNPSYAQLPFRNRHPSADFLRWFLLFGSLGLVFIGAAVVNTRTA